jgi:hypothetical protein
VIAFHGTSPSLRDQIERDGLREPIPDRGVWTTPNRALALSFAKARGWIDRHDRCLLVTLKLPDDAPIHQDPRLAQERHVLLPVIPADWIIGMEVVDLAAPTKATGLDAFLERAEAATAKFNGNLLGWARDRARDNY